MADASRVGYRTNGLSSALQLHHLSSRVGQTDGIAPPGVHHRRKPMDHAIADSHATVTISHRTIRSHQAPQRRASPEPLVLFWHEEGQETQEPGTCGPSRLTRSEGYARIGTYVPCRRKLKGTWERLDPGRNPKKGVPSNVSSPSAGP